jgi:hypothetical protein
MHLAVMEKAQAMEKQSIRLRNNGDENNGGENGSSGRR